MIYESNNQQPAVNVYPNGGGMNGGFGDGVFGGGFFWVIILFLFAMMMGWGNNGYASGNGGNSVAYVPYGMPMGGQNYVQQNFDQLAVMNGLNGLQTAVSTGFANAEVSRCNSQANLLATLNANQNANTAAMNGLAMSLQNCCCENRAATADLKYTVATEACADRAAVTAALNDVKTTMGQGFQGINDKLCQLELDGIKQRNADLLAEVNALKFAQSQTAQTAQILANNAAQTAALEQYLNPTPIPAYMVQNPNCCNTGCNNGCCGNVA